MTDPKPEARAQVALLVDWDNLRRGLAEGTAEPTAPAAVAEALLRYASGVGRVMLARAYGAWPGGTGEARDLQAAKILPVLVPPTADGKERTAIRLAADALEALYAGGEPDAFVLATGDATLLPLVQALRGDGSDVLLVAPARVAASDVPSEVDVFATMEDVLGGAVGRPTAPRPIRAEDAADDEAEDHGGWVAARPPPRAAAPSRPPPSYRPQPSAAPARGYPPRAPAPPPTMSFEGYDWAPFVKLIDELEHRLPFVGVRYLVNKVLGPRNCGIDDPRLKRDLINRAVDDGLIEMYPVGNVEDRTDPVTACRLDRKNAVVASILGPDTVTPVVPEAKEGETASLEDGGDSGGAEADD